jgi:biopolymer transport protein ExbD
LLALGLTPGRAARWSGQDEDAIFEPPAGPGLKISFRWTDAGGREHTVAASEWITAGEGSKAKPPEQWVFVGSDVRPDGRYLADRHGELISVSNFASATIDVPFESSADDALRDFVVATEKVPPQHTYVDVIIEPLPGAEKCPDARVVLEVDRLGQVLLDGKVVAMNELPQWAAKYLQDHQRGQVVLRIDPLARVGDVELAKAYLRSGGVREVVEQPLGASFYWLPRSASMARLRMIEWRDRFARPQEYIDAPDEKAANTLEVIRAQMAAMEAEKALLQEYAQQLEGLIEAHRKAQEAAETRDAD